MKKILSGSALVITVILLLIGAHLRFSSIKSVTEKDATEFKSSNISTTSGTFIVPSGGKEINRDTTGQQFFPSNVGEIIAINTVTPRNPNRLFFINENGTEIEIDPGLTQIRIIDLGQKPYISFINYGSETATIRVSRH